MRPWRAAIGVALLFAIPRCSCSNGPSEPNCASMTATNAHFVTETGICGGDFCQMQCNSGFADCNGSQSDGCEVSTTSAAPHEHVVDTNPSESSGCGAGGGGQVVGHLGTCNIECDFGFSDCNNSAADGCETPESSCFFQKDSSPFKDASSSDASDASSTSGQLLVTLNGAPRGLVACAGRIFYFDDDQLHAVDESTLTISIVTVSPQLPTQGLACDGSYVYWTTLPDADASTPNGSLMRASVDGTMHEVLATDLDPGQGIDVRPSGPIYFLAHSGFGAGPQIVAALVTDAGTTLDTWMPAFEGAYFRDFAWSTNDDWSLRGGLIHRRALGADASIPWTPAPNASGLLSDDAGSPYVVIHVPPAPDAGDAGPMDDFAQLDDDAGLVALDASVAPIVAATSNAETTIAASDETVYAVALPQGTTNVIATTTDHVVDVAYDSGWAAWTTRGGTHAQVWRAKVP